MPLSAFFIFRPLVVPVSLSSGIVILLFLRHSHTGPTLFYWTDAVCLLSFSPHYISHLALYSVAIAFIRPLCRGPSFRPFLLPFCSAVFRLFDVLFLSLTSRHRERSKWPEGEGQMRTFLLVAMVMKKSRPLLVGKRCHCRSLSTKRFRWLFSFGHWWRPLN